MPIWFRDLKISQKILGFVLISVILTSIIGLMGFFSIKSAKGKLNSMYNERLLSIKWLNENSTHIRTNEANLLWIILTPDRVQQKKYLDSMDDHAVKFDENVKNLEKLNLDTQEKNDLTNLKKYMEEYRTVRTKVIDMAIHGRSKQAFNYYLNNRSSFDDATKYMLIISEYNQQLAERINMQDDIEATKVSILIIFTIFAAIIISLSLTISAL
jgi:methyl-accepting chemotaxis protein